MSICVIYFDIWWDQRWGALCMKLPRSKSHRTKLLSPGAPASAQPMNRVGLLWKNAATSSSWTSGPQKMPSLLLLWEEFVPWTWDKPLAKQWSLKDSLNLVVHFQIYWLGQELIPYQPNPPLFAQARPCLILISPCAIFVQYLCNIFTLQMGISILRFPLIFMDVTFLHLPRKQKREKKRLP